MEAKEINDLFEKICREMYGKRTNSYYHYSEGPSNSKWYKTPENVMNLILIFSGYAQHVVLWKGGRLDV